METEKGQNVGDYRCMDPQKNIFNAATNTDQNP